MSILDPFLRQPNTLGSFTRAKHQGLLELLLVVFRLGLDDGPLISIMIGGRGVDDSGNNASSNHAGGSEAVTVATSVGGAITPLAAPLLELDREPAWKLLLGVLLLPLLLVLGRRHVFGLAIQVLRAGVLLDDLPLFELDLNGCNYIAGSPIEEEQEDGASIHDQMGDQKHDDGQARGNVLAKEVQLRRTDDEVIWAL